MPETWLASPAAAIVTLVPVVLWVAALLCAGIAMLWAPKPVSFRFIIDRLLRYLFLFPLGVQGLWAFLSHVFLAEDAASAIGWEASPFQYEVGVANLGLALASFYAAFKGFEARPATGIMAGCFLAGAGVGHLMDIAQGDNLAPGNAGPILFTDFLTPISILILLLLFPRHAEPEVVERVGAAAKPSLRDRMKRALKVPPTAASRLEEELETARRSMRQSLTSDPVNEVLPPTEPPAPKAPRKKRFLRGKSLPLPTDSELA
jgi:hypothetical protein